MTGITGDTRVRKMENDSTCSKNYNVSARSKESKGAINIFSNLIEKCNLRYVY